MQQRTVLKKIAAQARAFDWSLCNISLSDSKDRITKHNITTNKEKPYASNWPNLPGVVGMLSIAGYFASSITELTREGGREGAGGERDNMQ